VTVWGSGTPQREFLYVDDMATASIHVMNIDKKIYDKVTQPMVSHINIGSGYDLTIKDLAERIKSIVCYRGEIRFDLSKPDGTSRKLVDSTCLNMLDWQPQISIEQGLALSYEDFKENYSKYI